MRTFRRQTVRRQTIDRQTFRRHESDVSTTHFGRFDDNPWTSVSWLSAGSTLSCGFWRRGLLLSGILCVSALVPRRLVQRSIHPWAPLLCSPPLDDRYEETSLLKADMAPAERCDQVQGQCRVTTTSTWASLYRAAFCLKPTSGTFSELDLKFHGLSRSVWKLLAFYGRASVASAINANICTGFTVILAIQHSHIFVGETSKMCRRNVRPVSAKRLSINRFVVETSVHLAVYIMAARPTVIDSTDEITSLSRCHPMYWIEHSCTAHVSICSGDKNKTVACSKRMTMTTNSEHVSSAYMRVHVYNIVTNGNEELR